MKMIDATDWNWAEFLLAVEDFKLLVERDGAFAVMRLPRTMTREARRLIRDLGLEDYVEFDF